MVDSEGVELLLLPAMYEQPRRAAGGRDCVGSLVLASMAGISEALESEGSRLTPALLHSMSEEVGARAGRGVGALSVLRGVQGQGRRPPLLARACLPSACCTGGS